MADLPIHDRDFRGYGTNPPRIRWPNGARLAVSVVVNVEEGAELAIGMGDERNEAVYEVVEEVRGARDLCMESHFEYGTRAGWPRIRALLASYGVPATLNANGRAVALSPWLAQEAVADGHEVAAHGWRWETHAHMAESEERVAIARAVAAIRDATGTAPVGWHTRSATSVNTRRLLGEHGGFLYDSNAYNDDLPYVVEGAGRPHVVLPYAFDTNFDRLYEEGAGAPRMLSVGLHLRIIGRPGRIGGLERFLTHAASQPGTWFARREDIARAWLAGLAEVAQASDRRQAVG